MTKPFVLDPQDRALFRQAVGPVRRLRCDRVEPIAARPAPRPRFTEADERQALADALSDYFEPAELDTGEELYYRREGVQQAVLRKLRRGQFQVGAVLDLHGMTVTLMREELTAFLRRARRDGWGCVRIIHGKGRNSEERLPVLKNLVDRVLRQRADVLAFHSPPAKQGGTGAVLVLLDKD